MYRVDHNHLPPPLWGKTGKPIGVMLYIILKLSSILTLISEKKYFKNSKRLSFFTAILRKKIPTLKWFYHISNPCDVIFSQNRCKDLVVKNFWNIFFSKIRIELSFNMMCNMTPMGSPVLPQKPPHLRGVNGYDPPSTLYMLGIPSADFSSWSFDFSSSC